VTTPAEIADILDKAADHIETVGWFQGGLYDMYRDPAKPPTECRVCAMGAINVALHGSPLFPPYGDDAHDIAEYVERRLGADAEMATWNDMPGRTQDEVTAVFRETAAELRSAS
jgi:hypothetical protein